MPTVGGWMTPVVNTTPGLKSSIGVQPKKVVSNAGPGAQPTALNQTPTYVGSTPAPVGSPSGSSAASPYAAAAAAQLAAPAAATSAPRTLTQVAAPTAVNVARSDPNVDAMVSAYKARLAQLQKRPALDPTYTSRATSAARGEIMDTAAGAQEGATARLAAQGRLGGGGETRARSRISEAATRAANKAASDISIARTRDEENNALTRDAMENAFTLGGASIASAPADLALRQQSLGLQQQLGLGNLALGQGNLALDQDRFAAGRDDQRTATLLALLRSGGYSGF